MTKEPNNLVARWDLLSLFDDPDLSRDPTLRGVETAVKRYVDERYPLAVSEEDERVIRLFEDFLLASLRSQAT